MSDDFTIKQDLFRISEMGDRRISQAYKRAIILVGLTRVGKSTGYNWILDKKNIGVGTNIRSFYTNAKVRDRE